MIRWHWKPRASFEEPFLFLLLVSFQGVSLETFSIIKSVAACARGSGCCEMAGLMTGRLHSPSLQSTFFWGLWWRSRFLPCPVAGPRLNAEWDV